jgi:hypothetical protein
VPPGAVEVAWADRDTDREARDLDSGWAVVEGQAAGLVAVAERVEAVALAPARQEAAEAPACGSQAAVEEVLVEGQDLVVRAAEVEQAVEAERVREVVGLGVGMAVGMAVVGQGLVGLVVEAGQEQEPEPGVALVAAWAEVDLEVAAGQEPEPGVALVAAWAEVDLEVAAGQEPEVAEE